MLRAHGVSARARGRERHTLEQRLERVQLVIVGYLFELWGGGERWREWVGGRDTFGALGEGFAAEDILFLVLDDLDALCVERLLELMQVDGWCRGRPVHGAKRNKCWIMDV